MSNENNESRDPTSELTPEQMAVYQLAVKSVDNLMVIMQGQPCGVLSAMAFLLFEKYMQLAIPDDLEGVAEVMAGMARDMLDTAKAMRLAGKK